jgi:hypothetical protein
MVVVRHCVLLSSSTVMSRRPSACVSGVERDMGGVVVVVVVAAVDGAKGVLRHR